MQVLLAHGTPLTQHSTLRTQHSTLNAQHSTLNTQHPTLYTLPSTLNTQHSSRQVEAWLEQSLGVARDLKAKGSLRQAPPSAPNVKQFRGGLVSKAHRLVYHSTLGLRVINKKKSAGPQGQRQPPTGTALL